MITVVRKKSVKQVRIGGNTRWVSRFFEMFPQLAQTQPIEHDHR
jgi:hypothetical protein